MNTVAAKPQSVVAQRRIAMVSGVRTQEEARRIYLASANRLDLATLSRGFDRAPVDIDLVGKLPKR